MWSSRPSMKPLLCTMPRDKVGTRIGTFACRSFLRDTKASKRAKSVLYLFVGSKAKKISMPIDYRTQDEYSKFDYLVEIELEEFRRYTLGLDESIRKNKAETKKWVDQEIWIDKDEHMPTMAIEVLTHVDVFTPNLFYKSTLTGLYSFFESTFRELVKAEREKRKIKLKLDDLKGTGIILSKDFLEKVLEVNLNSLENVWTKIDNTRKIRNSIVHNDNDNPDSDRTKQVVKICKENDQLEYAGEVNILSSKYLIDFADNIYEYLKGTIKILRQ